MDNNENLVNGAIVSRYLVNILDVIKNSKKSKRNTALSHFDDFLCVYWREKKKEEPPTEKKKL